ncbi:MAG TPA: hypothetical protein VGK58_20885 [Lacipirellulaceae bacterium]
MRHLEVPDEFRPAWKQFCHTRGAKFKHFRPNRHIPTFNQQTTCARGRWAKLANFAPREKENNLVGAKVSGLSRTTQTQYRYFDAIMSIPRFLGRNPGSLRKW